MATNFPTNIDTFTDQTSSDLITSAKWNNLQDSIEALEVKVGADNSTVTTSHDYKLAELATTLGAITSAADVADFEKLHAITSTHTEINQLHGSGVVMADLVKLHAITLSYAQINALINNVPPVGSIIAYVPGYFTNGSNAGFTYRMVSANTIAAVNALLNSSGWYVCNGAALNDAGSGIFNGAGRYLPNLTDDRFFMGDTVAGGIGGANSNNISHTHTTGNFTLTTSHMPSHNHTVTVNSGGEHYHSVYHTQLREGLQNSIGGVTYGPNLAERVDTTNSGSHTHSASSGNTGSGQAHNHGSTGSAGSSSLENRPNYLSCFYIMRVK
jgi:hypothetical protein